MLAEAWGGLVRTRGRARGDVPGSPSLATHPSAALPATDLVGVGSDTAQDVMTQAGSTLATFGYGPN